MLFFFDFDTSLPLWQSRIIFFAARSARSSRHGPAPERGIDACATRWSSFFRRLSQSRRPGDSRSFVPDIETFAYHKRYGRSPKIGEEVNNNDALEQSHRIDRIL
jgi:hypothetical protein